MPFGDALSNVLKKRVVGETREGTENGDGKTSPFLVSLLTQLGLSPEKLKEQVEQITQEIAGRLKSIDEKLEHINVMTSTLNENDVAMTITLNMMDARLRDLASEHAGIAPTPDVELPSFADGEHFGLDNQEGKNDARRTTDNPDAGTGRG